MGQTIELNLKYLGRQTHKILVFAKGTTPELSEHLYKLNAKHSIVSHYIECLGPWDYELNIEVESLNEVTEFCNELQREYGESISDIVALNVAVVHKLRRCSFGEQRVVS